MDAGDEGNGICFPYDVLLDILRRLPAGAIAACKCVCRSWRDIVDGHKLSLERYFPRRAFPGLFVNKTGCRSNCTFFAPSSRRRLYYYPRKSKVKHSCNGLLLVEDCRYWGVYHVLNPATARYAILPRVTPQSIDLMSLAFDPARSLHYNVFLLQKNILVEQSQMGEEDPTLGEVQEELAGEAKERVVPLLVYSSCTGRWESRAFTPGHCAPGHLYDMAARSRAGYVFWSSEYWRGSLYVHCGNNVLMIMRPSEGTYDMVPLPCENCRPKSLYSLPRNSLLASYERGIHFVVIDGLQLWVWLLTESTNGQLGWTLAHDTCLSRHAHMIRPLKIERVTWWTVGSKSGPVSLTYDDDDDDEDLEGSDYSWNSDEENFIDVVGDDTHLGPSAGVINGGVVGFHSHKNAVILVIKLAVVVYHLDTLRMQYLGYELDLLHDSVEQAFHGSPWTCCVDDMFTYRHCYEDVLPVGKSSQSSEKVDGYVIHDT